MYFISWTINDRKVTLAHNEVTDGPIERYIDNDFYTVTKKEGDEINSEREDN